MLNVQIKVVKLSTIRMSSSSAFISAVTPFGFIWKLRLALNQHWVYLLVSFLNMVSLTLFSPPELTAGMVFVEVFISRSLFFWQKEFHEIAITRPLFQMTDRLIVCVFFLKNVAFSLIHLCDPKQLLQWLSCSPFLHKALDQRQHSLFNLWPVIVIQYRELGSG